MANTPLIRPPLSVLDANTQLFPHLTAAQVDRVRPYGKVREVKEGEILFQPGDTGIHFYVVLSGTLQIMQTEGTRETPVVEHRANQFTGELNMISGRPSLV